MQTDCRMARMETGGCTRQPATGEKSLLRLVSISPIPAAVLTVKPKLLQRMGLRPMPEPRRQAKPWPPTPPGATAESCQFPS